MSDTREIHVPDIGDFKDVDVIEVLVGPGDPIKTEQSLITVESDQATMEIPSPGEGVVKELKVKVGDKVSRGTLILLMEQAAGAAAPAPAEQADSGRLQDKPAVPPPPGAASARAPAPPAESSAPAASAEPPAGARVPPGAPVPFEPVKESPTFRPHAGPSVRRFARDLGVNLERVSGSGAKGRILHEDVQRFVKSVMQAAPAPAAAAPAGGFAFKLPEWPQVDFAKFGPVEVKPLSRIRKLSGGYLHRNWVSIPHVTQFDEADITDLEAFRKGNASSSEKQGFKLTLLAFLIKACVTALRQYPQFNASLDRDGQNLVLKNYYHIGVAVDTPEGLMVPVIRDADRKGVFELAQELSNMSRLARDKKLKPGDMQGGTFSISSLGGIGGTMFTPIINAPEVAILGVSKSTLRPVWKGTAEGNGQFVPRLLLPFALSYDHRVIDGADGARFASYLSSVLSDIRRSLL
ncbi:MAG: dihydrolipoyllysine-residue acetyltransferase [Burkholderiales bacterium]|nr:dihydrolipoyllysine-residue acetyltransferase [Burkholderiales bacterium]